MSTRVHTSSFRRPSRYLVLAIVAGLHLLAIIALRVELAVQSRDEVSAHSEVPPLIVSFIELVEPSEPVPAPTAPLRAPPLVSIAPVEPGSSAIQVPVPVEAPPKAPVDFDMELKRASQAMLDRAEEQARKDAPFAQRGEVPEALRPAPPGAREFAWSYRAERIQNGAIRVGEHCALILGILPVCQFGKIPVRTDLFADMRKPKSAEELDVPRSRSLESVDRETRIRLDAVTRLLGEWRAAHGNYPEDLSDLVSTALPGRVGPERVVILDTWNHKLLYRNPSQAAVCDYDLYSIGPNGVDDQGRRDDIVMCGSTPDLKF